MSKRILPRLARAAAALLTGSLVALAAAGCGDEDDDEGSCSEECREALDSCSAECDDDGCRASCDGDWEDCDEAC